MTFIIGVLLGGVALLFILQNMVPITVNFLSWEIEGSLALVLLIAVFAGISLPGLFEKASLRRYTRKLENELEQERIRRQEKEVELAQSKTPDVVVEKEEIVIEKGV
jgi:uncharacterized integral membrane protein